MFTLSLSCSASTNTVTFSGWKSEIVLNEERKGREKKTYFVAFYQVMHDTVCYYYSISIVMLLLFENIALPRQWGLPARLTFLTDRTEKIMKQTYKRILSNDTVTTTTTTDLHRNEFMYRNFCFSVTNDITL